MDMPAYMGSWMGGGTVGGGDPDDADRDGEYVEAWIKRTEETGTLDFDSLRKAATKEEEHYLDVLTDEVSKREETIRELHGQLSCLCAAIESHPVDQENDFLKVERERARILLDLHHIRETEKPVLRHHDGCMCDDCKLAGIEEADDTIDRLLRAWWHRRQDDGSAPPFTAKVLEELVEYLEGRLPACADKRKGEG